MNKMSMMSILGFTLFTIGIMIQYLETWYFGWNRFPGSIAEYIWDVIAGAMWILGLIMMCLGKI